MKSALNTICTVIVALIVFSQVYTYHSYMPSRQIEITRDLKKLAWANKGTPDIGSEQPVPDGRRLHALCYERMLDELDEVHPNGRTRATVSAAAYMACYGKEIDSSPVALCDKQNKKRYLTRLAAYFDERAADIEQDRRWRQLPLTSSAHVYVMMSGYVRQGETTDSSDFDVDSRIVAQLNHFVELGLLSKKADLAPFMDVGILSESSNDRQSATTQQEACK